MMKLTRRRFLLGTTAVGGGLLIGYAATRPSKHLIANRTAAADQSFLTTWLRITPDNIVTVIVPHSEMGQGVLTSLPMMAADEMDADWSLVKVEQAPATDLFANGILIKGFAGSLVSIPKFLDPLAESAGMKLAEIMNMQITGGSSSVRFTGELGMRVAGASAKEMLLLAASARWDVPADECSAKLSHVYHASSGRSASFGELAADAARFEPSRKPVLKQPAEFTLMGKNIPRIDIPAKVDGSAAFGIDAQPPGMLYAAVLTAPVFGSTLVSVDHAPALQKRGVKKVIELEGAVAVVADNYWRAQQALNALQPVFSETENDAVSSASLFSSFDNFIAEGDRNEDIKAGDSAAAFENADSTVEATYRVPYLAHAAMEPMNCTVHFHDGRCDVWTGTQDNLGIRGRVASVAGLDENDVTVHAFYLGGGFGRRLPQSTNTIDQATLIAREFDVPVQTLWSREEDTRQDYYRPAVSSQFRAGFDSGKQLVAWENIYTGKNEPAEAAHIPYSVPHQTISWVEAPTHVPFGAWRSVAHSQHTFFTESFVDEMAHHAGKNPYQFRLDMLAGKPRHARVLRAAAEKANWERTLPDGHALGIALQESFGSIAAQVAEVSIGSSGEVRVHRVSCAIDCGRVINPDGAAAQVESGIIYGLTAALYGQISIENGRVKEGNFSDYQMLHLATSPEIDVVLLESQDASVGGLGEPATPPVAAAVANAVYILTGQRIRELPFKNYRFLANPIEDQRSV
jgi:isoquinoline 1-oxidoreductase beta subunit